METVCVKLTEVARSVRRFRVDGFSMTATMGHQDFVKYRWDVDGYEWEIRIYPSTRYINNFGNSYCPCVVLELVFLSEARMLNVRATLVCRLLDPRGIAGASKEMSVLAKFCHPQDRSPSLHIMGRRDLESSSHLKDDCLLLECTIKLLKELPESTVPAPAKEVFVPSSNLHRHLAELLQSETGADVKFLVAGQSFAAHKNILAARSPVFMAEFFGDMKEKCSPSVEIKDMEAAVFNALLHFIYTDTVQEFDQVEEAVTVMAQHLFAAADRYGLDRLKLICESKLSAGISIDTAATNLALAEQHNSPQLKAKCVEFIVATLDAVSATEGYKHLEASCPSVLTDLLKFACRKNN